MEPFTVKNCLMCSIPVRIPPTVNLNPPEFRRNLELFCVHAGFDITRLPVHCNPNNFPFCGSCGDRVRLIAENHQLIENAQRSIYQNLEEARSITFKDYSATQARNHVGGGGASVGNMEASGVFSVGRGNETSSCFMPLRDWLYLDHLKSLLAEQEKRMSSGAPQNPGQVEGQHPQPGPSDNVPVILAVSGSAAPEPQLVGDPQVDNVQEIVVDEMEDRDDRDDEEEQDSDSDDNVDPEPENQRPATRRRSECKNGIKVRRRTRSQVTVRFQPLHGPTSDQTKRKYKMVKTKEHFCNARGCEFKTFRKSSLVLHQKVHQRGKKN